MGFYEELSRYYDIIFPMNLDTLNFINKRLKPNSRVLDIACGTGNYSIELAKLGKKVDGIDLDEEMIYKAKDKGKTEGLYIDFKADDMKKISELFNKNDYDLAFCIGNSLVHLNDKEEVFNLIKKIYSLLKADGGVIIQIVNYDRILKYNLDHLPTITRQDHGVEFIRNYELDIKGEKVYFNTEIIVNRDNEELKYSNSIPLLSLLSKDLKEILQEAGFREISLYGSFKEEEHNDSSFATIIHAIK